MNYPRIRELRLLHNLKQEYVAEQLNISQPEYSRLENGRREPRVEDFQCLSRLYGVSPGTFIPNQEPSRSFAEPDTGNLPQPRNPTSHIPYWVGLLEHHQEIMNTLIKTQQRSEQLFDRLIKLLDHKEVS
ncbi:MAG: helix-turn-helix transcriptional regulator [Crocinitomicaceae bacterium]|nr:helix-turn-helix transcriptional regulator [Crocinitomicaceae bacterium]